MSKKHKIVVAVSGASGAIYAKVLFDKLVQMKDQIKEVGILMSENAKFVWKTELGNKEYKKLRILCNWEPGTILFLETFSDEFFP